jgi:hypothetical protein
MEQSTEDTIMGDNHMVSRFRIRILLSALVSDSRMSEKPPGM